MESSWSPHGVSMDSVRTPWKLVGECQIQCDPVTNNVGPIFQVFIDGAQGMPLFCGDYFMQLENVIVKRELYILSNGRTSLE